MKVIDIMNVLNRFAIIFALLNLIFEVVDFGSPSNLLYFWAVLYTVFIIITRDKSSIIKYPIFAGIFVPIMWSSNIYEAAYIVIIGCYGIYYGSSSTSTGFDNVLDDFHRDIGIIIVSSALALITGNIYIMNTFCAKYVLINLITYTVILRYLRNVQYNIESKELRKINTIYSVSVFVFSFVICINDIREMILSGIVKLYNTTLSIIIELLKWFFLAVGYLGYILEFIIKFILKRINLKDNKIDMNFNPTLRYIEESKKINYLGQSRIFLLVVNLIIFSLIIFLIVKLFKKNFYRIKTEDEYHEEKEYIKIEKVAVSDRKIRTILDLLKPKNLNETIRYYYSIFLKKIIKQGIDIQKSDTSFDVNAKSADQFDNTILDKIREIYISGRYGNKKIDKQTVKKFVSLIKRL